MQGNDRIGLLKLFCAFFTKALQRITDGPTDEPTDGPTDGHHLAWQGWHRLSVSHTLILLNFPPLIYKASFFQTISKFLTFLGAAFVPPEVIKEADAAGVAAEAVAEAAAAAVGKGGAAVVNKPKFDSPAPI